VKAERQIQTALGCDTRLFDFPAGRDNAFLAEFPDLAGRPLLVFAGQFTHDRDLVAVINLAAALREWAPDVVVVLCGDGPARAGLIEHARAVGVLDNTVRILAPVPRRRLPHLLAASAMVLSVPQRNDTAGGFFDALAAARPVLAFGDSWQRSLVENRGAGFGMPAGDPRTVAKEVVEILRDTDGLRRAGQQAGALAAGRFHIDRIAAEQRTAIETLAAEAPRAEVLRRRALSAKRATDIIVATAALIVLSPLIVGLAIAVAVKIGPPFATRERVGLKGRVFRSIRFRTLTGTDIASGAAAEGPHMTSLGAFLEASGFAALPDLLNVLRGAMSLVGPAPLPPSYVPYYTPSQRRRHDMRPGLTGFAQVEGQNATGWEEIFTLDAAYVDGFTYGLDWRILGRTLLLLLQGVGIASGRGLPAYDAVMARREGAEDI
jgi:lipopolysaccharide/colanic/teichoic acid biosynthesis glycosyltransferase